VKVLRTQSEARAAITAARRSGNSIGLVPTLGALHDGHRSLMRAAIAAADVLVVSIFVNPLQFGPQEDYKAYPRDEEADLGIAEAESCDLLFAPPEAEMGMAKIETSITVGALGEVLEGAARPGHFAGVCVVVAKLLNILSPDLLFLGQKDAQQNAVLARMVRDLSFGCDLVVRPTVRGADGLALSSRNLYLSEEERGRAPALYRALTTGKARLEEDGDIAATEDAMRAVLMSAGITPDYARVVDPETFDAPRTPGRVLLVVAGRVGRARLIDNLVVDRGTGVAV
jgi:pantoate--beta-alanine ligase